VLTTYLAAATVSSASDDTPSRGGRQPRRRAGRRPRTRAASAIAAATRAASSASGAACVVRVNTPIAPANTPKTLADDPQFQDRLPWIPKDRLGADQLPFPVKVIGEELPVPEKAPTVGQHRDHVLRNVLGYDDAKIAALEKSGALG